MQEKGARGNGQSTAVNDVTVSPAAAGGASVPATQLPGLQSLLALAVGVVIIAGLYFGKDVLVPVTLAIILSFILSPVVLLLRRLWLPKGLAVAVAVLAALGLIGALGTLVGMQISSLAEEAPRYARTINSR